jgi:hypothetical protein
MKVWHWTGSAWEEAGAGQQTGGDGQPYYWVEVTGIDSFSSFVLKSSGAAPTALAARRLTAQSSGLIWSLVSLLLLVGWLYGSLGFCRATPSVALKAAKNCVFVGITDLFCVVTGLRVGMA